jgi:hypothetical protein
MTSITDLDALADASPFVFVGSVTRSGASAMHTVQADSFTAVVRVEEALRTPAGFANLAGQEVTVRLLAPLTTGQYVFFADLLAVGEGIAVQERAHLDASVEFARSDVGGAIARGYAARIRPRVSAATVVALGTVGQVRALAAVTQQDDDSVAWAAAPLQIEQLLKGDPRQRTATLVGPRVPTRRFPRTPVLRAGRRAVMMLQPPPSEATRLLAARSRRTALFVADTDDIQPPDRLEEIQRIIGEHRDGDVS